MFLVAHTGLATAPAALVARWWGERRGFAGPPPDLRWLIAGTVLPDLVDKTVGQVLFKPYFENGRIFGHTFVVALLVSVAGAYRWRRRGDSRVLLLACGMASHLVLDRMWTDPTTAFWPALGPFERHPSLQTILAQVIDALRDPFFWVDELGGAALLGLSLRWLGVRSRADLRSFVLAGRAPYLVQLEAGG